MMPIKSTAPISALRPGLAKNATMICLYSTNRISEHSTKNTSIRTRKILGEDSFESSISIAERVLGAIWQLSGLGRDRFGPQYGTATAGKQIRGGCCLRHSFCGIIIDIILSMEYLVMSWNVENTDEFTEWWNELTD